MHWKTARRAISLNRPLVMAILNVTPDSFSDGGEFLSVDDALRRAETMIEEGADIIDIGGESTRPGSSRVDPETEMRRTLPVITAIAKRFDIPLSIDTSKSSVAKAALESGAEIINDISGLRWDVQIAEVAAASGSGLVLMHSRGNFELMHSLLPVADILVEVTADFRRSLHIASEHGISDAQIILDVGIGFNKTFEQNLELIANLDRLMQTFEEFPLLVGLSRKSFIGKLLGGAPVNQRLSGSLAASAIALWNGASILRTHDIEATREIAIALASLSAVRYPNRRNK